MKKILILVGGAVLLSGSCCFGLLVYGYASYEEPVPAQKSAVAPTAANGQDDSLADPKEAPQGSSSEDSSDLKARLLGDWNGDPGLALTKPESDLSGLSYAELAQMARGETAIPFAFSGRYTFRDDGTCNYVEVRVEVVGNPGIPGSSAYVTDSCSYQVRGPIVAIKTHGVRTASGQDTKFTTNNDFSTNNEFTARFRHRKGKLKLKLSARDSHPMELERLE